MARLEGIELSLPLIVFNGGMLAAPNGGPNRILGHIEIETARRAMRAARALDLHVQAHTEHFLWTDELTPGLKEFLAQVRQPYRLVEDLARDLQEPPLKLFFAAYGRSAEEIAPSLAARLDSAARVVPCGPDFIEVLPAGVSKGAALAALADELGLVPEQIMALGDQYNDLEMIEYAGLGVAMANAPKPIRRRADHVAPGNDEDGVAWAIERFALGG